MTRTSGAILQTLIIAIFASAMFFFALATSRAAEAPMYVLSIVIWQTFNPAAGTHTVVTTAMPIEACLSLADKINMPRIFPHAVTGEARCLPELKFDFGNKSDQPNGFPQPPGPPMVPHRYTP